MSDREKWRALDLAEGKLLSLASYYSKVIYEEELKEFPDIQKITEWENERRLMMEIQRSLDVDDEIAIANINATYGPILRAFRAKG